LSFAIKNKPAFTGYLFAIIATLIWSGNYIVARGLKESIPPVSLAFWRWLVAIIVFLPFALKQLILEWKWVKKNFLFLSIISILGISIFNTLIYIAGQTTTAINLSLISITFPIFIVIIARLFLKETISINKIIGIIIVVFGVLLLVTKGNITELFLIDFVIGDFWMLLASLIFAIYSILLKYKPKEMSLLPFQLITFIIGTLYLLPYYIWEYTTSESVVLDKTTIGSILYVGIFASLIAFILWNKAILQVGATKAGLIYYTIPLFSGFFAYVFLKEKITAIHLYSLFLIISGILIALYTSKKNEKK
jgi:drug/metabolite transporter (DMT)-like permease